MNENLFGYACQLLFTSRNNVSLTVDKLFLISKYDWDIHDTILIMKCQELKPNILC